MLPWLEAGALERDIRSAIAGAAPDVVVTFGEDGLYWHPDHIAVYEATRAAVAALGTGAPALYYVTMPPGQMRGGARQPRPRACTPSSRRDLLGIDDADAFGAAAQPPTLVLDTGAFAVRKLAALRCHRTQVAGGPFDQLSAAEAEALLGVEHYRRADVGSQAPAFIERLASPIAGDLLMDVSLLDVLRCPFCGTRARSRGQRRAGPRRRADRLGRARLPVLRLPHRRRDPGAHRRRSDARRDARDGGRARATTRWRRCSASTPTGAPIACMRLLAGRRGHLPRGARDHQPRRGGHLLRLPLLRPHVRARRDAGARHRRRPPPHRARHRSVRRLRTSHAGAGRAQRPGRWSWPTCTSGSCGWRSASRRPGARPICCDANHPLPFARRRVLDGRAVGRLPLHLAQATACRGDAAARRRRTAPS